MVIETFMLTMMKAILGKYFRFIVRFFTDLVSDMFKSDDMDSDLEDKIMSMVQFKKKTPSPEKPEEAKVVYAPVGDDADNKNTNFSAANELQISEEEEDSYDEDIGTPENPPTPEDNDIIIQPQVTRYINLDDKHYMDDEETDEEEAELNAKLQDLIDDQVSWTK